MFFFVVCADGPMIEKNKKKKTKMLQEGLEPPTLGLLDPCSTKLSYQSGAAHARDRTKDLQIFSLTLSQLSYMGGSDRKRTRGNEKKDENKSCSKKKRKKIPGAEHSCAPAGN